MKEKRFGRDLTKGSIPRHLAAIAAPMLLGNLLNVGNSLIDTLWLGRIVGDAAVGATAVSWPVVFIFVAVAAGATMATSVLVAQYFGGGDTGAVERTVATSFTIAIAVGFICSVVGYAFSDTVLRMLKTPPAVMVLASQYLRIMFIGFGFMYLMFLVTAILRGLGDTRTPLYFMAIGVAVNALLDPLLIAGPGPFPRWGVGGAAVASVISTVVSLVLGVSYLNLRGSIVAFKPHRLRFFRSEAVQIFKIGIPSMIQHSLISLGMAAMTFIVNLFGAQAISAFGAAGRIDSIAFMPAMSLGMAISTLVGQNLGAGRFDRARESFRWGVAFTIAITGGCAIVFFLVPSALVSIFVSDPGVIRIGTGYLRIVGPSLVCFAVMFAVNGVINGAGQTMVTMIFSLVSLWGIRVPVAWFLSRTSLGVTGIWIGFAASSTIMMAVSYGYYRSGKWQRSLTGKAGAARA
jgi:putative MATE family efflux protein